MQHGTMQITEHDQGTMRFFAARTGARNLVTIRGSVLGGYAMLPEKLSMAPRIAAAVLDAGTRIRNKDVVREALASRGASLNFGPGADRTFFSATCLPEDLGFVLSLAAECLGTAVLPTSEIALQKKRTTARLEDQKTDTDTLAGGAFLRQVFSKNHLNYADTLEESIALTNKLTRNDCVQFQQLLGTGGLVLAITGDIVPERAIREAEKAFGKLPEGTRMPSEKIPNTKVAVDQEERFHIPDKASVDVYLGAPVPLTYTHPQFNAFWVMTNMLGGGGLFGGHLMRTVRERDGLTYGIYASGVGFGDGADGALQIYASFAPELYEKGVATTRNEINYFLQKGITEDTLSFKKGQLAGKYQVGLATSGGLAGTLHRIGIEGRPLSYIEEYPSLVNTLTVSDIKEAAALVPWDKLSTAAAGTFEK